MSTQNFWEECAGKTNALVIGGMYLSPGFSEAERPLHSTNNNNNKKALADPIQIAEDDFCVLDQCLDECCEQGELSWIATCNYCCP